MNGDDQVLARIEGWRRQLIDLSYGNRLIRYAATKATSLTITAPDVTTILADSVKDHENSPGVITRIPHL